MFFLAPCYGEVVFTIPVAPQTVNGSVTAIGGATAALQTTGNASAATTATNTGNLDVLLSTRTKPADNQAITIGDTQSRDAFGRFRVSQPFGIFDNKQISTRNTGDWEERIWGAIIVHGAVTGAGFQIGETITGGTSGEMGTITTVNAGSIVYSTTGGNDFTDGETITGGTSGSTAVVTSHNTGSDLVYQYDRSSTYLKVGTATGDRVVRQTTRYMPYVPLKGQYIGMTGVMGAGKTGVTQCMLYGDDLNGIGLCLVGTTLNIITRTSTSGSAVDTLIPQSAWNVDRLNPSLGLNPSGITLDVTKALIEGMDFQWLGVGRVRFGLDIGGNMTTIHEINHANIDGVVYMKTPSLPVRYEIKNTATSASSTTLEQICSSVMSEGGYALPGQEFSRGNGITRVAVTTRRPIFAIRLKNEFPAGKPNRRVARFLDFGTNAKTNDAYFELIHIHNPFGVTATWISNNVDSAVEYSTDISAVSGMMEHLVQPDNTPAGQGSASGSGTINAEFISNHSFISQNFESTNSQMFVVFATSEAGTSNVVSHISWIESE